MRQFMIGITHLLVLSYYIYFILYTKDILFNNIFMIVITLLCALFILFYRNDYSISEITNYLFIKDIEVYESNYWLMTFYVFFVILYLLNGNYAVPWQEVLFLATMIYTYAYFGTRTFSGEGRRVKKA